MICKKNLRLLTAIDPIHIGTGGYRMDRVDNSITRDMDDIPKIPGTSISGAVRGYAALATNENKCGGNINCGDCKICHTFGATRDYKSLKGLVNFYDGLILLFPVATVLGPVWITTPQRIREYLSEVVKEQELLSLQIPDDRFFPLNTEEFIGKDINLSWILLARFEQNQQCNESEEQVEDNLSKYLKSHLPEHVYQKIILVNDKIFYHVVNDNLEVRTSVAIDPATGAAIDKALFTYEAIPRMTVFYQVTTLLNPEHFYHKAKVDIDYVQELVDIGYQYMEFLGVGGMSTRGFGRIGCKIINEGVDEYADSPKL